MSEQQSLFGREDSEEYEVALRNFIRSSAAYISCVERWRLLDSRQSPATSSG